MVYEILSGDAGVSALANKVYPVISEEGASLPYVCYRRAAFEDKPVKTLSGADTVGVEVFCYGRTYAESIALAEAVRAALDGVSYTYESDGQPVLVARSIRLAESEEGWDADAYFQILTFEMKLNNV